ncbi:hypothetical protein ACOSQ4_010307 [Xanthoceras sorbifolium]
MLEGIGKIPKFKKTLHSAKVFTIFIYAHHKTLWLMKTYTKKGEIIRSGVTRFASSFLTLQSLVEKKESLSNMFTSTEWENYKWLRTAKGKAAYSTVLNMNFWNGVTLCLKVFAPLVKVLRLVDGDVKPSMDVDRLNNLVFIQFNSKLMNKQKKLMDKEANIDVLLASNGNASNAQGWMVDDGPKGVNDILGINWDNLPFNCYEHKFLETTDCYGEMGDNWSEDFW